MIEIICRETANEDELAQCLDIRRKIFVHEQHLFANTDQDEHDARAIHLAALFQNRIVGTVRVYEDFDGTWWGGRLAVLKKYRGRAGRELVISAQLLVKKRGVSRFYANILTENVNFFKNLGWLPVGGEFLLHDRQHQLVEADLSKPSPRL